jgi:hypothetical protein
MTDEQVIRRCAELGIPADYCPTEKAVRASNTNIHKVMHREFYTRRCPECLAWMYAFDRAHAA